MTVSYEAFVQDKLLPWGKMCAFDLPAMLADGVEILLEDVEFTAEDADADLCLMT